MSDNLLVTGLFQILRPYFQIFLDQQHGSLYRDHWPLPHLCSILALDNQYRPLNPSTLFLLAWPELIVYDWLCFCVQSIHTFFFYYIVFSNPQLWLFSWLSTFHSQSYPWLFCDLHTSHFKFGSPSQTSLLVPDCRVDCWLDISIWKFHTQFSINLSKFIFFPSLKFVISSIHFPSP